MYWFMKRWSSLVMMAVIAVLMFAIPPTADASVYEGTIAIDCAGMDATDTGTHILDRDNTGTGEERIRVLATDGDGTVILDYEYQTALGTYAGGIGDWAWTTAPDYNPIEVQIISMAGNGLPMQVDYTETGECEGLPVYTMVGAPGAGEADEMPEPGCPVLTPIPDDAVVGRFMAPATLFSVPGQPVVPEQVIEPGNTAWVLGLDASGQYYQILWVCQHVWVPVGTMGPNYDDLWNGAPLPTGVVS